MINRIDNFINKFMPTDVEVLESNLRVLVRMASSARSQDPRSIIRIQNLEAQIDAIRERLFGATPAPVPVQVLDLGMAVALQSIRRRPDDPTDDDSEAA